MPTAMPRAYLRKAAPAEDGTKARIFQACGELLMADSGFAGFTVDAVARQADVARATIYYRFGSKSGLLEAVLDDLAARSIVFPFEAIVSHVDRPDAIEDLARAIAAFWSAERPLMRRVYALAALDPDVGRSVAARDAERRAGVRAVVAGYLHSQGRASPATIDPAAAIAYTLLRFETFDTLAGDAALETVTPAITRLILLALD